VYVTASNPAGRRLVTFLMALMLAMGLVAVPLPASQAAAEEATASVDAELLERLAEEGEAAFWVVMKSEANLASASAIGSWTERGRYVYDELTATAERSQSGLLELLAERDVAHRSFWIVNAIHVTGDQALVDELASHPEVAEIRLERTYQLPEPAPAADGAKIMALEWGIERINADDVWADFGVRGEDIILGSLDTGVQFDHPALVEQYRGNNGDGTFEHNYNWHDPSNVCGNPSLVPCDNNGHGTHTTGTMVGDDGGDNQIGVAPAATWIAAKGCESTNCSEFALVSSGQWMLAPTDLEGNNPDTSKRPHIVNNSWGNDNGADTFYQGVVQAWVAAGIFPSFANGNAGPACGTVGAPASYPESFGVGGFDINDNVYTFSSRGPAPDAVGGEIRPHVSAPAVNVRSSIPTDGYGNGTGTSMATPHVSGTVALMWSAAPSLVGNLDETRDILAQTAIDTDDTSCGGTPENNNVWGEGRLDAFAAVDAAPRGATGTLEGTVTDAATSDPIGGATITIVGDVERTRTTGPDGTYSATLPVGDYDVTASAFGYASQTVQVTIAEDETTTADFALVTVDSVTLSGTVTDGGGHGWPIYAEVSVSGTPLSTWTDPFTGQYSLLLPAGATYEVVVEPDYDGYAGASESVTLGDTDETLDFALAVADCEAAPGYEFTVSIGILGEDSADPLGAYLAGQGIPSTPVTWEDDLASYDVIVINRPGDPGQAAFLDFLDATDASGTGVVFLDTWSTLGNGVWLLWQYVGNPSSRGTGFSSAIPYIYYEVLAEHPVVDGFAVGDEIVLAETGDKDHAWFGGYEGEGRTVIADAGRADTGIVGEGIGVQERANNRHVLLSMHASGPFSGPRFWHPDGGATFVESIGWAAQDASFECLTVDGGLVLGHVTDLNTGAGINGATVVSETNPAERGRSVATPDDPALDDGFYWLFSSALGSTDFTASAGRYASQTQTVDVVADAATRADFALGAGMLSVNPTEVEATVRLGQSANRTFVISNTGSAPVEVILSERRGSFEILGGGPAAEASGDGAEVRRVEGEFSPAAGPPERGGARGAAPASGPAADPWVDLPNYPQSVMDASAATVDDRVYVFGGFTPSGVTASASVFDPATESWSSIASIPGPRQKAEVVTVDGLIYVLGGWDNAGATMATTLIYDPATDSWSSGAAMPAGRTAPGAAVLDGQIYLVGGCTTNACPTTNTVFRYDPGADAWETLANYPESTGWLACGGLDGAVICAGGTDGTTTSTATYAYNPASDSWSERASLPYDNWAMGYAVANGQLVISGGVTQGFSVVTNEGARYDSALDAWSGIEPSNQSVYRVAGACGFYKVGGSTGGFTPQPFAEMHPDFGECLVDVDVPWLSVSPLSATLAPGQSVTVTVSMDSGATDEGQPGTYTAGVGIGHDTPYAVPPVGVTMNVTPPNNWGKIAGTVTGVSCQGQENPLSGATVQINGRQQQVTLSTDAQGGYARWMASNNSPLTLIVAHSGYQPQTRQVTLRPRQTVIANFALSAICGSGTLGGDATPR
jgi:subtilisin family serine protease/N-acetylneuraminic acid mutarotase